MMISMLSLLFFSTQTTLAADVVKLSATSDTGIQDCVRKLTLQHAQAKGLKHAMMAGIPYCTTSESALKKMTNSPATGVNFEVAVAYEATCQHSGEVYPASAQYTLTVSFTQNGKKCSLEKVQQ